MNQAAMGLLAAIGVCGCGARALTAGAPGELPDGGGADAAGALADGGASDAGPLRPDASTGLVIWGQIGGFDVTYVLRPGYVGAFNQRSNQPWFVDGQASDGVSLYVWGPGSLLDGQPSAVAGCVLRPPPGWVDGAGWICCGAGTVTKASADAHFETTLTSLSIVPACDGTGGPATLSYDRTDLVYSESSTLGCTFDLLYGTARPLRIYASACPADGVPTALDGARIVYLDESGDTACVGPGSSLTLTHGPDAFHDRLVVDIPSMTQPATCAGVPFEGELSASIL
jgi:hypothetical protein